MPRDYGQPAGARAVALARASYLAFFQDTLGAAMQANETPIPLLDKVVKVTKEHFDSAKDYRLDGPVVDRLVGLAAAWTSHITWNDKSPEWVQRGVSVYVKTVAEYQRLTAAEARKLLLSRGMEVSVWTPLDAWWRANSYTSGEFKFKDVTVWKPNKKASHIDAALAKVPGGATGEVFGASVRFTDCVRDHRMFRSPANNMLVYAAWWAAARHEFIQKAWAPERHQAWCLPIDEQALL
jgi:hypothetical protein